MHLCWNEILTVVCWVVGSWMLSIALLSALKLMCLWVTNAPVTNFSCFSCFASLCSNWGQCLHIPYIITWLNVLGFSYNKPPTNSSQMCCCWSCLLLDCTSANIIKGDGKSMHKPQKWHHSVSSHSLTRICSGVLGPFYPPTFSSVLILF